MSSYREDIIEFLELKFFGYPEIEPKTIFGHPGFSIMNRVFCFSYADGLAIKLPRNVYEQMLQNKDTVSPFSPGGSPMGTWIVLSLPDINDYKDHWDLIETAIEYIVTPEADPKKKSRRKRKR